MKTNLNLKKIKTYKANQDKLRKQAVNSGVNLVAPETIFLSKDTKFGKNVTINPYVVIGKKVKIGSNVEILSFSHIEGAKIGNKVKVGPYARIRPGTNLLPGVKIGNFVEIKNSNIESECQINHHSFVGDSDIYERVIVGAGTIICNHNGAETNRTTIKQGSFIGSGSSLVAPITVNANSTIAAGSTITEDVPEDVLAIARSRQLTKNSWKRKK